MKICKTQIHLGVVQLTLVEIQLGQVCLSKDKQTEGLDRPAEISSQCWERRGDAPASGWFNPGCSAEVRNAPWFFHIEVQAVPRHWLTQAGPNPAVGGFGGYVLGSVSDLGSLPSGYLSIPVTTR